MLKVLLLLNLIWLSLNHHDQCFAHHPGIDDEEFYVDFIPVTRDRAQHSCSGCFLQAYLFITSADCVYNNTPIRFHFTYQYKNITNGKKKLIQKYSTLDNVTFIVHPNYSINGNNIENNIALIEMKRPIKPVQVLKFYPLDSTDIMRTLNRRKCKTIIANDKENSLKTIDVNFTIGENCLCKFNNNNICVENLCITRKGSPLICDGKAVGIFQFYGYCNSTGNYSNDSKPYAILNCNTEYGISMFTNLFPNMPWITRHTKEPFPGLFQRSEVWSRRR
ncbi:hypothetical protein O3M35_003069 [Rhynocoris fuscipes]|uniref:Peptidase S1 domain-containing protein n=1 Tax=Rhynocoris fuscipes TaxID=488301 RepID=A0AAW1CLT0_9HEMI